MEGPLLARSEQDLDDGNQGGSPSNDAHIINVPADEQTEHEAGWFKLCALFNLVNVWNLFEVVVTLAQIVASIFVLTQSKDEQIRLELFIWLISYTCASIATLPFICCRLCDSSKSCFNEDAKTCMEKALDYFIVGLVMVFLLDILAYPTTLDKTTQFFWFWVALLAFSCIRYVLPKLKIALSCYLFTLCSLFEVVVTLAQVVASIYVLTLSKHEHIPQELYIWLISYTCASIASFPFICCRLCDGSTLCFDEESKTCVEKALDYFIVGLVMMFLLEVLADPTALVYTSLLFWFWAALLAFSCFRYVLPKLTPALVCFVLPLACVLQQIWDIVEKFLCIFSKCCCDDD